MTKIIGHRGAAGLALENTIKSIQTAREYNVDAIEFDVRLTKDEHVVLSHDRHLARVSINPSKIAELELDEVLKVELFDDHRISTLQDAIKACGDTPMVIELKELGMAERVLEILEKYKDKSITITSLWHDELRVVRKQRPDIPILVRDQLSPIDIVTTARQMDAAGINLNVWLLNPLTYYLAKRWNLTVMVYTVNHKMLARFLNKLYPNIMICTNRPDKFKRKRQLLKQAAKKVKQLKRTKATRKAAVK